ncbi:MAG TPA: ABC transporter ATP-binding protein [Trueperaceae bacterium]|nr:ABC transporter ATP-binding protein [Trueperaceae bacterium]
MLELNNASYEYRLKGRRIKIFEGIKHEFARGSFTSITAPSGQGKTTLLNILGLLDSLTAGEYMVSGQNVNNLNDKAKSALRSEIFGFLFQDYRLIPTLTVFDNINLALEIKYNNDKKYTQEVMRVLTMVDLADRAKHLPAELSGGESQRVAFARAIVKQPKVLLADEPTGNLDEKNRDHLLSLIKDFHQSGNTIVMVTHDVVAAKQAEFVLKLEKAKLRFQ